MLRIKIIFLFSMFCLVSCVREEIVPFDATGTSKVVVFGFLSPGDRINIFVGRSQPFGKTNYQPQDFHEPNATVVLSDESGKQQILSLGIQDGSVYSCPQAVFPIIAGKKYNISISLDNHIVATATTTVPESPAKWSTKSLTGPQEDLYYTFSGSWKDLNDPRVDYGVGIAQQNIGSNRTNEGITKTNDTYIIKRDVFLANTSSIKAILLTRDFSFGNFSRKADLTMDVIENLSNAAFADVISGFKGVIPDAGNINGGIGVFGSYLTDITTLNK